MAATPLPPPLPSSPSPSPPPRSSFLPWQAALRLGLAIGASSLSLAHLSPPPHVARCSMAPFSCFSLALAPPSVDRHVVEPSTGVSFPSQLQEGQQLLGVGLRKKNILGLKSITVYAFGIYADEGSFKDKLGSKYGQCSTTDLQGNKFFSEDVLATDSHLTVRLVIVYGRLKIGTVRSAFEESIGSRIKKFSGSENRDLLQSFTSLFKDEYKLPPGTTIDIARHPGHVLKTKIGGEEIGMVQSPLLCRALFDLYLGEEPFDKKAKEEIGMGLASLITN